MFFEPPSGSWAISLNAYVIRHILRPDTTEHRIHDRPVASLICAERKSQDLVNSPFIHYSFSMELMVHGITRIKEEALADVQSDRQSV
jgi:hypothetical protein